MTERASKFISMQTVIKSIKGKMKSLSEKKCEIHKTVLKLMQVPLSYGLPHFDDVLIEARAKLFPNAKFDLLGGCTVSDKHYSEESVCEQCREAEIKWRKENNREIRKIGDIKL